MKLSKYVENCGDGGKNVKQIDNNSQPRRKLSLKTKKLLKFFIIHIIFFHSRKLASDQCNYDKNAFILSSDSKNLSSFSTKLVDNKNYMENDLRARVFGRLFANLDKNFVP